MKNKVTALDLIDKIDSLLDLIIVCSISYENIADKSLPISVVYTFVHEDLKKIQEMLRDL